jgi:ribosome recycling factor
MTTAILQQAEQRMKKTLDSIQHELLSIRTGKASPAMLDAIKVDAYGQPMAIKQVANVSVSDTRLLVLQAWDKGMVSHIEKAIRDANMGFNPISDGLVIKIPIPPLTEDRRKEFVKLTKKFGEEGKIALRNIRRDANDALKKLEKDGLSEDQRKQGEKDVQTLTDKYTKSIEDILGKKEKEIMEV